MIFTQSREINTGLCDLYDRGLRAYMSLKTKLEQLLRHNIPNTMKYFDSLIKPLQLYSSDFRGCLKLPENTPTEKLSNMPCKNILDVSKETVKGGTLLELGRISLRGKDKVHH